MHCMHVLLDNDCSIGVAISIIYVTGFAKTVPIGTTIEILFMA